MIVPIDYHVNLVPQPVCELIDHADQVELLIVKVPKAEESHILPLDFREISEERLRGDRGGSCCVGFGCVGLRCISGRGISGVGHSHWEYQGTVWLALILIDRCHSEVAGFNVWVIGPHLEGDVLWCLVTEVEIDAIIIRAHGGIVLMNVQIGSVL